MVEMVNLIISEYSKLEQKDGKSTEDSLEKMILKKINFLSYYQIVYAQNRIFQRECDTEFCGILKYKYIA